MPRTKRKVNKSAAIRELLAQGVTSPSEVVAKLKEKGVNVSASMVSNAKHAALKNSGRKGRRGRQAKNGSAGAAVLLPEAVVFVRRCGSMQEAIGALQHLAELQV